MIMETRRAGSKENVPQKWHGAPRFLPRPTPRSSSAAGAVRPPEGTMKSVWYCRERRTPPVVEITFEPGWKAVTVRYEGEALGVPADRPELEAGRTYTAKDGSELTVRLPRPAAFPEVDLNGKRLLLTVGDPVKV